MLVSLQGADGVDVGFCNVFYQVVFSHPDANVFNFIFYLTGVVGGFWEMLFGTFGLLGFRLLEALVLASAIALLYLTFRRNMPEQLILMAIAVSFVFPLLSVTFHYDTFSYLLIAASAYSYKQAVESERKRWLLCSGMMIAFAIFARIVNATLLILLLLPFVSFYRHNRRVTALQSSMLMLFGFLAGVLLVLFLMVSLGHAEYYISALHEAFGTFNSEEATHSRGYLVWKFFHGYLNILMQVAVVGAMAFLWMKGNHSLRGRKRVAALCFLAVVFTIVSYTSPPYTSLMALCLLICVVGLYSDFLKRKDSSTVLFLVVATFVFPFGSDIGAQGIFNWCVGLLVFPTFYYVGKSSVVVRRGLVTAFLCIVVSALVRTAYKVYGDGVPRYKCTAMLQPERLNVFVNPNRAIAARHIIGSINKYTADNPLLLLINQQSELYYATRTLPFLGHTQPLVYLGRMEERLNERVRHFGNYPVVVFLKQDHDTSETPEVKAAIEKWMHNNSYRMVSNDKYCIVYVNPTYTYSHRTR